MLGGKQKGILRKKPQNGAFWEIIHSLGVV